MTGTTNRNSRTLFLITILTGSFLLFLVQPMVARMALPRLGGAPAVWNSAMLVYQALLLLAGYAYAHRLSREPAFGDRPLSTFRFLLSRFCGCRSVLQGSIHRLMAHRFSGYRGCLVASIGPLFFVVAAQAPLMQRWYGHGGQ